MRLTTSPSCVVVLAALAARVLSYPAPPIQSVLAKWEDNELSRYPTDFTRDITPKPIHSHNDYWRSTPALSAIAVGAISIEADVWLYNSSLLVGHHPSALTENRTLDSLYLSPLTSIIEKQNPNSPYITGNPTRWGVFDTAPDQTLFLWIDMKTAGNETFDAVVEALEPLRKKGWLTTHDGKTLRRGPITVIGTGSTPRARVEAQSPRFVFYDAPLGRLGEDANKNITSAVSLIASTSLKRMVGDVIGDGLSESQLAKVRAQIKEAADKGIGARYWETPWWPTQRRNNVWKQLVNEGVALLGVDEVQVAANLL